MTQVRENRLRRPTQSEALAGTAFIVAHLAMIIEVMRSAGPLGGRLAMAIVLVNFLFALFVRFVWRFRIVSTLAIFSTTAMTEALFWRAAWNGHRTTELAFAGLSAVLFFALFVIVFFLIDRDRRS